MLTEHTPVWVWDGYWWPALVVLPTLDSERDKMLVRFTNGVTAPVKTSAVRFRDSANPGELLSYQFAAGVSKERQQVPVGALTARPGRYGM